MGLRAALWNCTQTLRCVELNVCMVTQWHGADITPIADHVHPSYRYMLWGSWMSAWNFRAIYQIVESGPEWSLCLNISSWFLSDYVLMWSDTNSAVSPFSDTLLPHVSNCKLLPGRKMQHVSWQKGKHSSLSAVSLNDTHKTSQPLKVSPEMWNYRPDCANYPVTLTSWFGSGDFHCGVSDIIASACC